MTMAGSGMTANADFATLSVGGTVVGEYHEGASLPRTSSPRPFLRLRSVGGHRVTESAPADHPHHMDLSLALPDVDGTTFWGGRTYVSGTGSTMLDNHGIQTSVSRRRTASTIDDELEWSDSRDDLLLRESRRIAVAPFDDGWVLDWRSSLRGNESAVSFGSPQTNGRDGAFYGGIFWRTPLGDAEVRSAAGAGADAAHGSDSPWLAVLTDEVTIVCTAPRARWFIRADGYVGFGPAVAYDSRRRIEKDETLDLEMSAAVIDGRRSDAEVERMARALRDRGSL